MDLQIKDFLKTTKIYGRYLSQFLLPDQIDVLAESLQKHIEKKLIITDVVASLLCVDSDGLSFITKGKTYNLLEESDTLYKITDDDDDEFWYDKKHFVKKQA